MTSYRDYLNRQGVAPGPWVTRVSDSDGVGNTDGIRLVRERQELSRIVPTRRGFIAKLWRGM